LGDGKPVMGVGRVLAVWGRGQGSGGELGIFCG